MTPVAVTLQQPSSLHVIARRPEADAAIRFPTCSLFTFTYYLKQEAKFYDRSIQTSQFFHRGPY